MSELQVPDSSFIIEAILGDRFEEIESLRYGASHSGHGVRFGVYSENGEDFTRVAVKPYWGRKAEDSARREMAMTQTAKRRGFRTLEPLGYLVGEVDLVGNAAVSLTVYKPDVPSGNTLTIEEDPETRKGLWVASAVGSVAVCLAAMHNKLLTHGDAQMKNFGFPRNQPLSESPVIFDLEKANVFDSKRKPGVCSRPEEFEGAIRRDLVHLSFSLGMRQYGQGIPGHFMETVIDPYMDVVCDSIKSTTRFIPLVGGVVERFHLTREKYALQKDIVQ